MGGETGQNNSHGLMENAMAMKKIRFRKLAVADLPQVIHIQETITKKKIGPKKITQWGDTIRNDSSLSLVALDGDQVVGFVISEIMTNSFGLDQSGWIKIIGVHPKHMGVGIGQALITQLFRQFKKRKIHEIYTAAQWDAVDLLSFFKSIGFDRSKFINLYKKLGRKE
jgi:ribosomal protein S18 acetylase RimI-like enzyme